jgi:ORF6N domain
MAIILKPENVAQLVFFIRGEKVMLDFDLATLYGVTTGNLNKAVKRNFERFPVDFMFKLTPQEAKSLRFQSGSLKRGQHFKYPPHAFTEQGVAMLSSVLRSERAAQVNIAIMRTFVQLRRLMDGNADLARKIENLEKKYDEKFATVFAAIKQLIAPDAPAKPRIGFKP